MHIQTIYFDMDGVLVDLDRRLSMIIGKDIRDEAPAHDPKSDEFVKQLIRDNLQKNVFALAPPTLNFPKFKWLMEELQKNVSVEILSSCMEAKSYPEIKRQKIQWLQMHGLGNFTANFTVSGKAKANFADAYSVLVDDMAENCKSFRAKGGYAIVYLHNNFEKMKKDLFKLL